MKKELLDKASVDTLKLIKAEAESNLKEIHNIENIITDKTEKLFKLVITFLVIVMGYALKSYSENDFGDLFLLAILFTVLFLIAAIVLYKVIFPKATIVLGSEPDNLVQEDMIKGSEKDEKYILGNRVYNLQKAINTSKSSYLNRIKHYRSANKVLLIGIVSIVIAFILFQFYQYLY